MTQQSDPLHANVHSHGDGIVHTSPAGSPPCPDDWINDFPADQLLPSRQGQTAIPSGVLRHALASIPALLLDYAFTPGHTLLLRDGQWVCDHGCFIDLSDVGPEVRNGG
jgi:hypothetical protein